MEFFRSPPIRRAIRPALADASTRRSVWLKASSLVAPGQVLTGSRYDYRVIEQARKEGPRLASRFKAEVIPRDKASAGAPKWAAIETASHKDDEAKLRLGMERNIYRALGTRQHACFRELYDEIDEDTLAFEWMDYNLGEIPNQPGRYTSSNLDFVIAVLKAACEGSVALAGVALPEGRLFKPTLPFDDILINIDAKDPDPDTYRHNRITVKVGDLGVAVPSPFPPDWIGSLGYPTRAPETFLGGPFTERSHVWAAAAALLNWLKPDLLGALDSPLHSDHDPQWCLAKLKRLIPDWDIPSPDKFERGSPLATVAGDAADLARDRAFPQLQGILPLAEELEKLKETSLAEEPPGDEARLDILVFLLRNMLEPDPAQRPSATTVLKSDSLATLEDMHLGTMWFCFHHRRGRELGLPFSYERMGFEVSMIERALSNMGDRRRARLAAESGTDVKPDSAQRRKVLLLELRPATEDGKL